MKTSFFVSVLVFCICFLSLVAWSITRACLYISFRNHCEKSITKALNTESVAIFRSEMLSVISYLDCEEKASGTTAIFNRKGHSDISLFYGNARKSYEKSLLISDDIPEEQRLTELRDIQYMLEVSYGLMPKGMSVAPNNRAYFIWASISTLLLAASTLILAINVIREMK